MRERDREREMKEREASGWDGPARCEEVLQRRLDSGDDDDIVKLKLECCGTLRPSQAEPTRNLTHVCG